MTLENKCLLAPYCSKAGDERFCNHTCFPHVRLHGVNGNGGLIAIANIPNKYRKTVIESVPFKDDETIFLKIKRYCHNVVQDVDRGVGLYLFGIPSHSNPKGTGTGKTTAAVAILIEYLRRLTMLEAQGKRKIHHEPALFMKMAKFQNTYNAQFRGSQEITEEKADIYQELKRKMMKVDLLVWDDIGLRGVTEALQNEIYEIIDERETNEKATIFTSNVPIERLPSMLGEQVSSRIEGMAYPIGFGGEDHRRKSF